MKRRMFRRDVENYSVIVQIPYGCGEEPFSLCCHRPIGHNYGVFGWNWDFWTMYIAGRNIGVISGYRVPKSLITCSITNDEFERIENNARKFITAAQIYGSRQDRYIAVTFIENGWKTLLADKGVIFE